MAYFNTELAKSRELHPLDIFVLQILHQNKSDDMSEDLNLLMDDDMIKRLYEANLVQMIKGTKKMNEFQKLRLSKKGKKWLSDFQTYKVVENDYKLFDVLKQIYLKEEKEIGSEKKTLELIAWFRLETGFSHKAIWLIAKKFVEDEQRMEYSKVLEYAFWKSTNHFQTQPKLEDSKMFSYYEKYKDYFDKEIEKLDNK